MVSISEAAKALKAFKKRQAELGIVDGGNVLQQKWDLKDVMESMPLTDFKKLVRFYLDIDEEKTLQKFFRSYDDYYETMLDTIAERKRSRAAVKRTMEGLN